MKNLFKYLRKIDRRLLAIWLLIFTSFATLDLVATNSLPVTIIKLFGLFLCLVYVSLFFRHDRPLVFAFLATFVADLLLAINNLSQFGLFAFILAQFFHHCRLKGLDIGSRKLLITLAVVAVYFVIVVGFGDVATYLLAAPYAVLLVSNLYLSRKQYKKSPTRATTFAFYGFALFALCDICVATAFLSKIAIFDYLDWLFYYPAQVFLSISSKKVATRPKFMLK